MTCHYLFFSYNEKIKMNKIYCILQLYASIIIAKRNCVIFMIHYNLHLEYISNILQLLIYTSIYVYMNDYDIISVFRMA